MTQQPADTSSLPVVDLDAYLADPTSSAGQAECTKVRRSTPSPCWHEDWQRCRAS